MRLNAAGVCMRGYTKVLLLLSLLALGPVELGDACSCAPLHPQQHFCYSDIVIRAKVIKDKVVSPKNNPHFLQYEIKLVKMFKGFQKVQDIQYLYTPIESSLCGVNLNSRNRTEYLITARMSKRGDVLVELCDLVTPWKHVTTSQKRNLRYRYHKGCSCKISMCYNPPCTTNPEECLWTDWLLGDYEEQALHYACVKRGEGFCNWLRGSPVQGKNFLDTADI